MTDFAKRNTLKILAATTGAIAATAITSSVAGATHSFDATPKGTTSTSTPALTVSSRLASSNGDLELVITNPGPKAARIDRVSPAKLLLANGDFDLGSLTRDRETTINAGGTITVPLNKREAPRQTALSHTVRSLNDVITNNVSLQTTTVGRTRRLFT